MLPRTRALLASAAALAAVLPGQEPAPRAHARAERRFAAAVRARDAAYEALAAEYSATEAWVRGDAQAAPQPPEPLRRFWEDAGVPPQEWPERRAALAADPFHELWNRELYLRSRAAAAYARAVAELEEAFLDLERLRHPERFQRAYAEAPPGMAYIPGGRYVLGPNTGYLLGHPRFQEERTVRLRPFYLDRREVTCAEYARFLLAQPQELREGHLPTAWTLTSDGSPLFPEGAASVPVAGIPWASAARYAAWAGKRLPSEDEWEAAAAGLERRRYPLGERFDAAKVNCRAHGAGGPRPASECPEDATPNGIQGLSGNLREWTVDLYEERGAGMAAQPVKKPGPYTLAVVRGGSFSDEAEACTSVFRWLEPALSARLANVGFRCAADVR